MSIFEKRVNYKPFEYPEVLGFIELINKTYWVHNEIDFTADIQDFHTGMSDTEREVLKRSLLGIAQIEVGVKSFWGNLYNIFPKPELNGLGVTFAENEFRHSEAYARLLEVLGYNNEFESLLEVPVIKNKTRLIENLLQSNSDPVMKLVFFTLIIENTSLFSLFANILSFTRFKGKLKNVSNIIAWTSTEENIHAKAGMWLINKIQEENGDFDEAGKEYIRNSVDLYMIVEEQMIEWVYEKGELDSFSKEDMINFMKLRIDNALSAIGVKELYNITPKEYKPMEWFEEELAVNALDDFFAKRPTDYTKHDKPITANDLF